MDATSNKLLEAALAYAEMGYAVFPCVPGTKTPLTEHGYLDATVDPDQIEKWWTTHPEANVGLSTQGLLVLDIDGQGNPWLADAPERLLDLARGPMVLTPHGGSHRIFRQPPGKPWRCTESRLAPKVDTRADGGYVVVPPSVLKGDKAYCWAPGLELDGAPESLPEPPGWLVEDLDRLANGTPTLAHVAARGAEGNKIPTGQRNATLAKLAGTMRRVGMSHAEIAAALAQVNADRCVPPLVSREVERIATSIARYEPDQITVALVENHWAQICAEHDNDVSTNADPGPIPDGLLSVPGFLSDVMAYTLQTAPYPEPALAFCGALALQALLAGRKVRDESDNRTNVFILGLANSGAGKDHPRKVNQRILWHAGMSGCLGDTFASGEGIEDRLSLNPAMLFQTDEIDGLMSKINLGKDARHEGIMSVLLKMYTSASSIYPMRVKASKEPGVIDQPCLCIFGTAIPQHYYEALSLKMLSNGFFARMLIMETGKRSKGQDAILRDVPGSILQTAQWWADFVPGGKPGNLANWHPIPRLVEHTPEAREILRMFREQAESEYSVAEDAVDEAGMAIWARANEKARRLALIYACSANHAVSRITADAARWACAFVEHQTRRMLFMSTEHVSENDFDARCKKLVATLRKWREQHGDDWMPCWQLNRRHPWTQREHEDIRTTLLNQRLIEYQDRKTGGAPQRLYRLA
jgi:Bifunctional DNA primase/polymerase, N-terminal/Primase C terminal 1 (PriCT-1)/Protein of unknown function (DUF3987)